jgi:glutaredoxin
MNRSTILWIPRYAALALSASAAVAPAEAEIYRWTAPNGRIHFGDHKPSGESAGPAEPFQGRGALSFIAGGTAHPRKIRLFTATDCATCQAARDYLKKRGTPFDELDVSRSLSAKSEFERVGGKTLPVILLDRQRLDGFEAGLVDMMLAYQD